MKNEILKYQKYGAIYVAKNKPDYSYIFWIVVLFCAFPYIMLSGFDSFSEAMQVFIEDPSYFSYMFLGDLLILVLFLVALYTFLNFKIIVTPNELIIKTFSEQRVAIKNITEIGSCHYRKGTKTEIVSSDSKYYSFPYKCDVESLVEFLRKINPNIKNADDDNPLNKLKILVKGSR